MGAAQEVVRVQLAEKLTSTQIQTSGLVFVYALQDTQKYKVSKPATLDIRITKDGKMQLGALKKKGSLVIIPAKGTLLTFQNNTYTGSFFAIPKGQTFRLVEYTPIENYLLGVLPYEMSYSWPLEALKAQAVAARTYTVMHLKNSEAPFDLYNDVRSQMYKGSGKVYDSVKQAVSQTKGQVLTYQRHLFHTYYHANCGGGTDDVKIWTGSAAKTPKPLQGVTCDTDRNSKSFSWNVIIPQKAINDFAHQKGLKGHVNKIKVAKQTDSKRTATLQLYTDKGNQTVSCAQFRLAVGAAKLRSCKITNIQKTATGFSFSGNGFGHGVGMCQDGAKGMAKEGKNYAQILSHYFPSSTLSTL